jgi:hypothetical protein
VVRASDCQCQSCNFPGFNLSILRHSGILGAADEAGLKRKKDYDSRKYNNNSQREWRVETKAYQKKDLNYYPDLVCFN